MRVRGSARAGYSMVEMLTVIAIIGILAGLLYPVFSRVRARGRQTSCISNMHQVWQALEQFRMDERNYPRTIQAALVAAGSGKTVQQLQCPDNPSDSPSEPVQWAPAQCIARLGYVDMQRYDFTTPIPQANTYDGQLYTARQLAELGCGSGGDPSTLLYIPHYALYRLPTGAKNDPDYKRQLFFRKPVGDAVVTWCIYHGPMTGQGQVLFQSGTVSSYPINEVVTRSWHLPPRSG